MADRTLDELNWRRNFCQFCIKLIDTETPKTDPRRAPAMDLYKEQLADIDAQITKLTGTPPPITVGLKTAVMFPKSELKKE